MSPPWSPSPHLPPPLSSRILTAGVMEKGSCECLSSFLSLVLTRLRLRSQALESSWGRRWEY